MADDDGPRYVPSTQGFHPPDAGPRSLAALRGQLRTEEGTRLFGQAVIQWLRQVWGDPKECPYCANPTWEVGEHLLDLRLSGQAAVTVVVPVACTRCGNTVLIDAVTAGFLDPTGPA